MTSIYFCGKIHTSAFSPFIRCHRLPQALGRITYEKCASTFCIYIIILSLLYRCVKHYIKFFLKKSVLYFSAAAEKPHFLYYGIFYRILGGDYRIFKAVFVIAAFSVCVKRSIAQLGAYIYFSYSVVYRVSEIFVRQSAAAVQYEGLFAH